MSTVKVLRATDPYAGGSHVFSIVASDSKAEYVFPEDRNLFNGEGQLKFALDYYGSKPKDVDKWLEAAVFNLDSFDFKPFVPEETDFDDCVSVEQNALDSVTAPTAPNTPASQRISEAMNNLLASDDEYADYMFDPLNSDLSEDKRKLLIATLIAAAGTQDLNPWLMPWLNGETDLDTMGFKRLVLTRPFNSQIPSFDSETDVGTEGVTE